MPILRRILSEIGIEHPDGRPLYALPITAEKHDELRKQLRFRVASGQVLGSTAAGFVLWAAEHIRSRFKGGQLSWDFVFRGLGLREDQPLGRELVERGLSWWKRKVRISEAGIHLLNFRLLHEVVAVLPGRGTSTRIEISTAQLDRRERMGHQAYHSYPNDQERRAVLEKLFPRAKVSILPKAQQPHARSLELKLNDGRRLQILLDQGFGAWRADGFARHDFREAPDRQAMKIKQNDIRLRMGEKNGAPVIMEFL